MTAPELARHFQERFRTLESSGLKAGFGDIRHGIVEHSDIFEVVGYTAVSAEPQWSYDGLALRIAFVSFPRPEVDCRLQWTSWMAAPTMQIRANFPPLILKQKTLTGATDAQISSVSDRFASLLAREIARKRPPDFLERLWIRFVA